ncbi:MAG: sigma-70 family RNA polymerase sigma factor [Bacteroidetes bacterium]|nr:sigma-70 family RNA polymerase sigma factor [Bacteroidota bacterium]
MLTLTSEQLEKAIRRDPETITLIVRKTSGPLYNIIYQLVKNREDAEDALQETYIRMMNNLAGFRGDSQITTWLYRIATNTALEKIRRNQSKNGHQDFNDEEFQEVTITNRHALDQFNPEDAMLSQEFRDVLNRYLQELPEKTRLVFILRDQENLSLEEVVAVTGDSEWSVKGRLKRARSFLREKLAAYMTEGAVRYDS